VRVARVYLSNNPMLWIALSDEAMLKTVKREAYLPK